MRRVFATVSIVSGARQVHSSDSARAIQNKELIHIDATSHFASPWLFEDTNRHI